MDVGSILDDCLDDFHVFRIPIFASFFYVVVMCFLICLIFESFGESSPTRILLDEHMQLLRTNCFFHESAFQQLELFPSIPASFLHGLPTNIYDFLHYYSHIHSSIVLLNMLPKKHMVGQGQELVGQGQELVG